jgi:hypothetical protein
LMCEHSASSANCSPRSTPASSLMLGYSELMPKRSRAHRRRAAIAVNADDSSGAVSRPRRLCA